MKKLLIIISIVGLVLTIVPSVLVFAQEITIESHKRFMFFGMLLWFFTAPFWIEEKDL